MSDGQVTYETAGGVAVITMDHPHKRNALNETMCEQLHAAWRRFAASPDDRVAILTGAGGVFTAGADLNGPPANFFDAIPEIGVRLDKPVIAAVAGPVIGGGVSMVAMCDLCVAAETTRFIYPEAKVGVTAGLIAAIASRVPHKVAMEIMLLGGTMDAARAHQVGFVNRVVATGTELAVAREMAAVLAASAPMVLATLKGLVRETLPRSPVERVHDARRAIEPVMRSADMQEGLAAFREKRAPRFEGR